MSEEYNGWTNRETWAASIWVQEDINCYSFWCEQAQAMEVVHLIGALQAEFDEPVAGMQAGWHKDMLSFSLGRVDWYEIAEALREDAMTALGEEEAAAEEWLKANTHMFNR